MRHFLVIALAVFAMLLAAPAISAPVDFSLNWFTMSSGGGEGSGGGFALEGIMGQIQVGVMRGEGYEVQGGFQSGTDVLYRLHLPAVHAGQ